MILIANGTKQLSESAIKWGSLANIWNYRKDLPVCQVFFVCKYLVFHHQRRLGSVVHLPAIPAPNIQDPRGDYLTVNREVLIFNNLHKSSICFFRALGVEKAVTNVDTFHNDSYIENLGDSTLFRPSIESLRRSSRVTPTCHTGWQRLRSRVQNATRRMDVYLLLSFLCRLRRD